MKPNKVFILIFILAGSLISCKKEGCTDSSAVNYDADAKKDNGTCVFPEPEPDPRDPYLGDYLVTDTLYMFGSFYEAVTYTLNVSTGGTSSDTIYLNNLWNDGDNYYAIMTDSSFSMPSQQVSGPYYTSGQGDFNSEVITYETSGDVYVNKGVGPKQ